MARRVVRWEEVVGRKIETAGYRHACLVLGFQDLEIAIRSADRCQGVELYRYLVSDRARAGIPPGLYHAEGRYYTVSDGGREPIEPGDLVGRHLTGVVSRHFLGGWAHKPAWTELLLDDEDWVLLSSEDWTKAVEIAEP